MTSKVVFEPGPGLGVIFGYREEHLRQLETALGVRLVARGNEVSIRGPRASVQAAARVLERMREARAPLTPEAARGTAESAVAREAPRAGVLVSADIRVPRQTITPRGVRQREYVKSIRSNDVVFGVGPAGTGKTYLAVACALESLLGQSVERIILARPVVEAGERLGFLPGDVQDKVNPYMRPLYDALQDMLELNTLRRLIEQEAVEIAPLAYMRGRTLNKAFIILDEAQNTTGEQMKMFLTRLGFGSKVVVTGDVTQIDLPGG
ncbi:MAG: PhoH family protein, partial [bacterium]